MSNLTDAEIDRIVDGLMERIDEIGRAFRGDRAPTYPPGVEPERMRELHRAALRKSIADAS